MLQRVNSEEVDDGIYKIKHQYFRNIFNDEYMRNAFDYFQKSDVRKNIANNKVIREDPIFSQIEQLEAFDEDRVGNVYQPIRKDTQIELEEKVLQISKLRSSVLKIEENPTKIEIIIPKAQQSEEPNAYNYSSNMDRILYNQYSDFGYFKDFESVIRFANSCYERDEISKYLEILKINQNLEGMVKGKIQRYSPYPIMRLDLEEKMFGIYRNEIDKNIDVNNYF